MEKSLERTYSFLMCIYLYMRKNTFDTGKPSMNALLLTVCSSCDRTDSAHTSPEPGFILC